MPPLSATRSKLAGGLPVIGELDGDRLGLNIASLNASVAELSPIHAVSLRAGAILSEAQSMTQSAQASIEAGVISVLKAVNPRPIEPTLGSDLVTDLGFDSLQIMEVIAELEDRFDVSIPLNDVPSTRTVSQIVAQVTALVDARATA